MSHIVLKQALDKHQFLEASGPRVYHKDVVEGTLEYLRIQIDAVLDQCSKTKVKTAKMKPVIRSILRMSVYQILNMERDTGLRGL
ncbi:MAG: transcription antitermination factor NusB [Pilosibacter sp.]